MSRLSEHADEPNRFLAEARALSSVRQSTGARSPAARLVLGGEAAEDLDARMSIR